MKRKRIFALALAAAMGSSMTMPVMAGQWKQYETGFKYQNDGGSYPANSWQRIDGKCYYFDGNGYMLKNMTTRDGYQVDTSGAWVVNGEVQTRTDVGVAQTQATNTTSNAEYPLAGMLEQLGLNDTGVEGWSDRATLNMQNGPYLPSAGKYKYTNLGYSGLSAFACALSGEPYHDYWNEVTDPVQIIAGFNGVSYAEAQQMVGIVRDLLNSFDWKNASDRERVKRAAELVTNGVSYGNPGAGYVSGILLDHSGGCNHFAATFHLLTRLMGMDSLHVFDGTHEYNLVKVDGTWYNFDGSAISKSHAPITISDVFNVTLDGLRFPSQEAFIELGIRDQALDGNMGHYYYLD